MAERTSQLLASGGLVAGSVLGMAGTFVPSPPLRGLLWGCDGVSLVIAAALLTIHYFRKGHDVVAAGFLVYALGQSLVLTSAAMALDASGPVFGAGVALWAASLYMLSGPKLAATWVRIVGAIAGSLFLVVAVRLFTGNMLTPLSQPLPFFAYPFLVVTLFGWAWERYRSVA